MLIHSDKYYMMEWASVNDAVQCALHMQNRCKRGIYASNPGYALVYARAQCSSVGRRTAATKLPGYKSPTICEDPSQPYLVLDPTPVKRGKLILLHVLSPDGHPAWVRFAWHFGWKDIVTGQRVGVK